MWVVDLRNGRNLNGGDMDEMDGRQGMPDKQILELRRGRILSQRSVLETGSGVVVVLDGRDLCYLTGMPEGILAAIIQEGRTTLFTTIVFEEELKEKVGWCRIVTTSQSPRERPGLYQYLANWMGREGISGFIVDSTHASHHAITSLTNESRNQGISVHPIRDLIAQVRAVKDPFELGMIESCVAIAEQAFEEFKNLGASHIVGRSEKEIAWELEERMRGHGAVRQGFPGTGLIVASGPNSAGVHPQPGERKVQPNEPLLIDWGAERNEYRSDSTRVLFPGGVPDWAREVYEVVREALEAGVGNLGAGKPVNRVDLSARDVIVNAGYQEFFYGVGHGVGLMIHEMPWIRPESKEVFADNMCTTVEPGIYLPGKGGIRIENIYQVIPDGSRRLGALSTSLEDMVLD